MAGELDVLIEEAAASLGYQSLKEEQKGAVKAFVEGKDVFVSLPTGYGKSLCYALLPLVIDKRRETVEKRSIVMVVSPLIALMKDQSAKFTERGVAAVCISDLESMDKSLRRKVVNGEYQIVYISPEALFLRTDWRRMLAGDLYRRNLVGFIIDEAHCVTKWGDNFRREFSRLGEIRSIIPEHVCVMALTATATKSSRTKIIRSLDMQGPVVVSVPPVKKNIFFCVAEKSTVGVSLGPLVDRLGQQRTSMGRTIIFCRTYDEVTSIYYFFKQKLGQTFTEPPGAPDLPQFRLIDMYTRSTHPSVKDKILDRFTSSTCLRIVVATIAFGMGIDCPDVRQVIHWGVPEDVETYVQETGRAGRDGIPSCALIMYGKGDIGKRRTSEQMRDYCINATKLCRKVALFSDFDGCDDVVKEGGCQCCDVCRKECMCTTCQKSVDVFYFGC